MLKSISANRIIAGAAIFLVMTLTLNSLPDDSRSIVLPIVMFAVFVRAAMKSPPIAILILLYYSMIQGGWLILAAAPITMLLSRRYQRQRLQLDLNPLHIRRTVLIAVAAMAATIPFIAASLGAWSGRSQGSPSSSASPLVSRPRPGEEGALQRFAQWLGFGEDGDPFNQLDPLQPVPVRPRPPDDPFNWWIVVAVLAILGLLVLAWWLWRRSQRTPAPDYAPVVAAPLARLEAVGERIGRPRAPHEGVITYGRVLADKTGDERLASVGPLVSGQVYQSAFASPREVGANLATLEATPPPLPPPPTVAERFAMRLAQLPSNRALGIGLLAVIAIVITGWIVVPRLGELRQPGRFESGLEQLQIVPLGTEHIDDL